MKIRAFYFLVIVFLLISCNRQTDISDPIDPISEGELRGTQEDYINTSITFGLSMFSDVNACGEENALISPYSLQTALYMTMNGTDNATLEEFRTALNTDKFYPYGLNIHYEDIAALLTPQGENTSFQSENAVFYYPAFFTPFSDYQDIINNTYNGTFQEEDFSDLGTVEVINNWVSEKTDDRIKKVLDKIEADEAIFLINALVFTGDWKIGFDNRSTQDLPFTLADGSIINVPTMQSDDVRSYNIQDDYSALDLEVKDGDYSMTIVSPNNMTNIDALIESFDLEKYQDLYAGLSAGRVDVRLPKFELTTHKNMKDILIKRGMTTAFEAADLSKMGDFAGSPYLSRVLHDAYIKVDEAGIEGAAVTTVGVGVESLPPSIVFDRPFMIIVRHIETQLPIFIGKVGKPVE